MKITHSLVLVVIAILEMGREDDGRIWGYALSKKSGVRSGVLYPQLDRMLNEGWLEDHWEEQSPARKRPPRRYYTVTQDGWRSLGAIAHRASSEQRFAGLQLVKANWAPA
ncbi:helix-turn-helix transcriptional regulator [Dietzia sp. SL131]|uniref:PadR family transcriptional regulator n=1 Tax=Dietzia sp. SL131 TaxID=2995149 RepID=UPI00227A4437|nr:helix-turn-helix transcriptional regulator [Dietzia sp. SL131]MCY1659277.1 helix-turn-helix transcriptional regulator [Dietzia sp. SL131]